MTSRSQEASPGHLRYQAPDESFESYSARFQAMGGIVEELLPDVTASPSGQAYIGPELDVRLVSTHDQVLTGPDLQRFQGSHFPAAPRYRQRVQAATAAVGRTLAARGARGRFSVDFVESRARRSTPSRSTCAAGARRTPSTRRPRSPMAPTTCAPGACSTSAAVPRPTTRQTTCSPGPTRVSGPRSCWTTRLLLGLSYDPTRERGCIFHMLGALPEFGKLGVTCIANSRREALQDFDSTRCRHGPLPATLTTASRLDSGRGGS